MDGLAFQFVIIILAFLFASFALFRMIRKNFVKKKFDSKRTNCDRDCGCS